MTRVELASFLPLLPLTTAAVDGNGWALVGVWGVVAVVRNREDEVKARPFYIVRWESGELAGDDELVGSLAEVRRLLREETYPDEVVRVFRVTASEDITDKVRPA